MGRWLPELIIPPEDRPDFEDLLARTTPGVPKEGRVEARIERPPLHKDGSRLPGRARPDARSRSTGGRSSTR